MIALRGDRGDSLLALASAGVSSPPDAALQWRRSGRLWRGADVVGDASCRGVCIWMVEVEFLRSERILHFLVELMAAGRCARRF